MTEVMGFPTFFVFTEDKKMTWTDEAEKVRLEEQGELDNDTIEYMNYRASLRRQSGRADKLVFVWSVVVIAFVIAMTVAAEVIEYYLWWEL